MNRLINIIYIIYTDGWVLRVVLANKGLLRTLTFPSAARDYTWELRVKMVERDHLERERENRKASRSGNGDDDSDGCGVCLNYERIFERENLT